jgi:hypothetical protein
MLLQQKRRSVSKYEFAMSSVGSFVARARQSVHAGLLAISISVLCACSTLDHYAAVPPGETEKATFPMYAFLPIGQLKFRLNKNVRSFEKRKL